ncbi:MAG: hypothetical protein ABEJ35_03600 [Halobacteriaceae archaeon]
MSGDPTRVVADADVLAADLLIDGDARAALECVWRHSWMTLVASPRLVAEAETVIARLADDGLAQTWRAAIRDWAEFVEHPPGDQPALGSARAGDAAHVLTLDAALQSAESNVTLQQWLDISVRAPAAFETVFDPEALYEAAVGDAYPGPDRPPRA